MSTIILFFSLATVMAFGFSTLHEQLERIEQRLKKLEERKP